ncbi:MAG: flagellar basal body L-ring protein FlgH [Rhodospirillales bacterium]|nr:flagellar basal body L-ring protein FlgH [Rhodospirillales bacterium]
MHMRFYSRTFRPLAIVLAASLLSACNTVERLTRLGEEPKMTRVQDPSIGQPPVTMPAPPPDNSQRHTNSLWRSGARAFFKDQRASQVGDIMTVTITIADTASLSNNSTRSRTSAETANSTKLLGYENQIWGRLPGVQGAIDPTSLVNLGANSTGTGGGTITRSESVSLKVAAVVTQVLPNGNLVVKGSQEVRVNFETRVLEVAGVIRPQDIRSDNQIPYDRIAEARISYGGRGQLTDRNQARWGQELYDILFPF